MNVLRSFLSLFLVLVFALSLYTPYMDAVYSQAGSPLPGAEVEVAFGPDPSYGLTAHANLNGELTLDLYQGVDHSLTVSARGYISQMVNLPAVNNAGPIQQVVTLDPAALIEGYVKTPDGRPVVGAIVDTEIDSTVTDSNGYFAVYAEPGANVTVSVFPPVNYGMFLGVFGNVSMFGIPAGYKDFVVFSPLAGNQHVVSKSLYVLVNSQRLQVNVTVDFSARVSGQVIYQNGTPVPNATVMMTNPNTIIGFGSFGMTDEFGNYEVGQDLPNGPANVSVMVAGNSWIVLFNNVLENFNVNCALPCDNPQNLDITIPNLVKVTGRLIDKAGRPIPNVDITGFFNNGSYVTTFTTDQNGYFVGFVPQGYQGNLTSFVSFGLPPIINIAINAGGNPINLGDVVANTNLFYVSGTVQGYDPYNIYWRGTSVEVVATINLGFQQLSVSFKGELYDNGSFRVPVFTNITIPFLPFQPNIQYSLVLKNSYRGALLQPGLGLPDINQDIANVNVQVNLGPTYQLVLRIEASGMPEQSAQRIFVNTAMYAGRSLNVTVSSNTHVSNVFTALLIYNPRGELYFYIETIPGTGEYTIQFPTEMLGEPYTLTYFSLDTGSEEPLNTQVSVSNGVTTITFTNPEGGDTIIVKVESTNVISEFNTLYILISIVALTAMIYIFLRRRS